jgi:HisA/HisF family protein
MDVIPVLDLMKGRVVQGERGQRHRYRPIESLLVAGSEPVAVAQALHRETDCPAFYVADLDALMGVGDHRDVIGALRDQLGTDLWVDAAVDSPAAALRLLAMGATRAIVGTETLPDLAALRDIAGELPAERLLVSLDMGAEGVISRCPELSGLQPLAALETLCTAAALTSVILLFLEQVGTGAGLDIATLQAARQAFPSLTLLSGGGVRAPDDLRVLAALGIDGVLLATALHRGWITAADLREQKLRG